MDDVAVEGGGCCISMWESWIAICISTSSSDSRPVGEGVGAVIALTKGYGKAVPALEVACLGVVGSVWVDEMEGGVAGAVADAAEGAVGACGRWPMGMHQASLLSSSRFEVVLTMCRLRRR